MHRAQRRSVPSGLGDAAALVVVAAKADGRARAVFSMSLNSCHLPPARRVSHTVRDNVKTRGYNRRFPTALLPKVQIVKVINIDSVFLRARRAQRK